MSSITIGGKSQHRQLVEFFSDTTLAVRGFRPQITVAGTARLKKVLELNLLSKNEIEQMMLYYLASKSFKNLGPSIATMLSATILNALRDKARNREQYFKEIEEYTDRYLRKEAPRGHTIKSGGHSHTLNMKSIADRIKEMQEKLHSREGVQG